MSINLQEIITKLKTAREELQGQQRFAEFATGLDEIISHTSEPLMLMVMGSFSTGKSSFINALVGEEIAAVEAKPTTAVVTKLCYGEQDKLVLHFRDGKVKPATPTEFNRMTAVNDESQLNEIHDKLDYVERQMPLEILKQVSIIDSPGLNDVQEKHSEATERFVSKADTVLWMFSTVQLATREEMAAMDRLTPRLKPIAVVNKMDLLDEEEDDPQEFLAKAKQTLKDRVQAVVGISAKYELEGKKENNALKREIGNFAELEKAVADLVLPYREKFKLNTLLDELGVYFAAFNREFAKAKEENEANKNRNYEVYMQNEEIFMQVEDILTNVISGIQDYCEREAGRNNEQALYLLGVLCDAGIGVLQNTEKALKFYQKAALKKHQGAMLNMYNYYSEQGADETAAYWLKKLAEQGLLEAQKKYIDLLKMQEKYDEYFSWCEKLAGQGDIGAQYKLAECLTKGMGCALNELKAVSLYRKIVGRWNKEQQYELAEILYNETGLVKSKDASELYAIVINAEANYSINKLVHRSGGSIDCKKEAYFWYKKLAEQGYIAAEKRLAECLYAGIVCTKNLKEALRWYEKAYKQGLKGVGPVIESIKAKLRVEEYRKKAEKGDVQAQYNLAKCLEKGAGCQKNIDAAFVWYETAAEGGHAESQYIWGEYLYKEAKCVEAVEFYRKAAEQGHKYAARSLAECLEKGDGCQKNLQEALHWYKKAYAEGVKIKQRIELIEKVLSEKALFNKYTKDTKKGIVSAQYALAECLYSGRGCAVNVTQAVALYEQIIEKWSAEDQYIFANNFYYINIKYNFQKISDVYRKAIDKDKNYQINADMKWLCNQKRDWKGKSVGEYWLKKAAEKGLAEAQHKYADILQAKNDNEEAFKWYKKAAEQGLAQAQGNLAECYINGVGVTADFELAKKWCEKAAQQNVAKAQYYMGALFCLNATERYNWYRKAAEQGYANAQDELANYLNEGIGCEKDKAEAFKWYKKAAEQNIANAQNMVGRYLEDGWSGIANNEEAVEWYRKAAEQGYADAQDNLGSCLYNGKGCTQNYKEAVKWYRKAAEQGNIYAQNNLGECLYSGEGCTQSYQEAVSWFRKAAERGYGRAQCNLGNCLYNGKGYTKNYDDAVEWYRKAAEQGYMYAQNNLGNCLYNGKGCTQNYQEAVKWYRKSAEQGYNRAQYNLAQCLENGKGCEKGYEEALKWYKKAAEQGYADAQYALAQCLENGRGCDADKKEAVKWYRKAAEQGDTDAKKVLERIDAENKFFKLRNKAEEGNVAVQYELAEHLYYGKDCSQDYKEAVHWYRKAAEQGHIYAEYSLGYCLDKGSGCPQDYKQAVYWYRKAAEQGYDKAQFSLALCLEMGQGCEKNYKEAVKWYRKAAEQGSDEAQYQLGNCLFFGQGCVKNRKKAIEWYKKSSAQGNMRAKAALNGIKMSSTSSRVTAQSSGCLLPILGALAVIVLFVVL